MSTFPSSDSASETHVALQDLHFRYTERSEELYGGLTHAFTPGAVTAITGESGRGKSTLLYIIGLLLRPSEGEVVLADNRLSQLSDRQASKIRANRIGFVFQDAELDPSRPVLDSVLEPGIYAGTPREELKQRGLELLDQFGLAERAAHKPGQISGGQAQRVAICRALVNDPRVILADEPTGNLDPKNSQMVLGALKEAAESGRTVVIATHDPTVIDAADEVIQL